MLKTASYVFISVFLFFIVQGSVSAGNPFAYWFSQGILTTDPTAKIAEYTKAIKAWHPVDGMVFLSFAYNGRGMAYFSLKSYDKAIEDFDEAIGIEPSVAAPYVNRGNARYELKQTRTAITDYTLGIELDPTVPRFFLNRGKAYLAAGEKTKAGLDFAAAVRMDPSLKSEVPKS